MAKFVPPRAPGGTRRRGPGPGPGPGPAAAAGRERSAAPTAWQEQADWYDHLVGDTGDDLYGGVLLPKVCERLAAKPGERVLDICCGQGVLARRLAAAGIAVSGLDAAPALISKAQARAGTLERYTVADARRMADVVKDGPYDHGAIVMALQDLDPMPAVIQGAAGLIRRGGRLVIALTHPCFRIPKRSSWVVDERQGVRYRRLDSYLSPHTALIRTHPGQGEASPTTTSHHRPLGAYVAALASAGFAVVGFDELISPRRGSKGRASASEDRATEEFPLFLVLTAVRL